MKKEKVKKIYEGLEKALLQEECTYEEARMAVDKLRETYFNKKAGNYLKNVSLQKIASTVPSSCDHAKAENGSRIRETDSREKEMKTMVETETKTDFIGFSSTIKKKGREGCIQVFTQVQGMPVTDKELAELRRLQEEAAAKVDEMLKD